jgi:epoxyqueuosine reductase QueG
MLITPEYGSRVRLALVLTDAPFKPGNIESVELPCIKCGGACIKICPVKAIAKPRKGEQWNINKYACNTYLEATAGCAECLRVCPAGKK